MQKEQEMNWNNPQKTKKGNINSPKRSNLKKRRDSRENMEIVAQASFQAQKSLFFIQNHKKRGTSLRVNPKQQKNKKNKSINKKKLMEKVKKIQPQKTKSPTEKVNKNKPKKKSKKIILDKQAKKEQYQKLLKENKVKRMSMAPGFKFGSHIKQKIHKSRNSLDIMHGDLFDQLEIYEKINKPNLKHVSSNLTKTDETFKSMKQRLLSKDNLKSRENSSVKNTLWNGTVEKEINLNMLNSKENSLNRIDSFSNLQEKKSIKKENILESSNEDIKLNKKEDFISISKEFNTYQTNENSNKVLPILEKSQRKLRKFEKKRTSELSKNSSQQNFYQRNCGIRKMNLRQSHNLFSSKGINAEFTQFGNNNLNHSWAHDKESLRNNVSETYGTGNGPNNKLPILESFGEIPESNNNIEQSKNDENEFKEIIKILKNNYSYFKKDLKQFIMNHSLQNSRTFIDNNNSNLAFENKSIESFREIIKRSTSLEDDPQIIVKKKSVKKINRKQTISKLKNKKKKINKKNSEEGLLKQTKNSFNNTLKNQSKQRKTSKIKAQDKRNILKKKSSPKDLIVNKKKTKGKKKSLIIASNSKLNLSKNQLLKTCEQSKKQSYPNLPSYKKISSKIFDNELNTSVDQNLTNSKKVSKIDKDFRNKLKQVQNSTKANHNSFKESFSKKYYIKQAEKQNLLSSQKKIVLSSIDRIPTSNKVVKIRKKKKNTIIEKPITNEYSEEINLIKSPHGSVQRSSRIITSPIKDFSSLVKNNKSKKQSVFQNNQMENSRMSQYIIPSFESPSKTKNKKFSQFNPNNISTSINKQSKNCIRLIQSPKNKIEQSGIPSFSINESNDAIFFKESQLIQNNKEEQDNYLVIQQNPREPKMSFGKEIQENDKNQLGWSSPSDYKNTLNFGDYFSKSKNLQKKFSEKFPKDQLDTFQENMKDQLHSQEINNFDSFEKSSNHPSHSNPSINPFQREPDNESLKSEEIYNEYGQKSMLDNSQIKQEGISNMSNTNMSEFSKNVFLDFGEEEPFSKANNSDNFMIGKAKSHQEMRYTSDMSNKKNFFKRRISENNEYFKNYYMSEKEYKKFLYSIKRRLRWLIKGVHNHHWEKNKLRKSIIEKNAPLAKIVKQKSSRVDLNLQVIINRSKNKNLIKNQFLIEGHIAESTFSNTFKCVDTKAENHRKACVKKIKDDKHFLDQSLMEIQILKFLKEEGDPDENNFLKLFDYFYQGRDLYIVTELLSYNLYEAIIRPQKILPESSLRKIMKDILISLKFFKKCGLIHSDLKPENIVFKLDDNESVKVIDFGSATYIYEECQEYVQTRPYRAPEIIFGCEYDFAVDIWSLGCILYELITSKVLFGQKNLHQILTQLLSLTLSKELDENPEFVNLITNQELLDEKPLSDIPKSLPDSRFGSPTIIKKKKDILSRDSNELWSKNSSQRNLSFESNNKSGKTQIKKLEMNKINQTKSQKSNETNPQINKDQISNYNSKFLSNVKEKKLIEKSNQIGKLLCSILQPFSEGSRFNEFVNQGNLNSDFLLVKQITKTKTVISQQDNLTKNYNSFNTNEDSLERGSPFRKPFEENQFEVYIPNEYYIMNDLINQNGTTHKNDTFAATKSFQLLSQKLKEGFGISDELFDFLKKCLIINPLERMTVEEALNHPFITKNDVLKDENSFGN